ncbi:MAG TPA: hypothetical protein VGF14_08140 [Alphaproteobacteria bacterium]
MKKTGMVFPIFKSVLDVVEKPTSSTETSAPKVSHIAWAKSFTDAYWSQGDKASVVRDAQKGYIAHIS